MDAASPVSRPARAGRFRLEEKLGSDAGSETYRASLVDGVGAAVVRIVHARGEDGVGSARHERLLRETRRAARVSHEGLALVLEVGVTEDGDVFVATEKIEGERLSDRLRAGAPLPELEAAAIAARIASALSAAHDAGIVHRDLHPSLIALSGVGEATRVKVENLATPRALGAALRAAIDPTPASSPASVRGSAPSLRQGPRSGSNPSNPSNPSTPSSPFAVAMGRPPAAPPPRPLGRPLTARPRWEEMLLDVRDGPLPRIALTVVVAFVIMRILTLGAVPFVVAVVAGVAAYAVRFWRGPRG
jgi:serine/threonine protein kinase